MKFRCKGSIKIAGKEFSFEKGSSEADIEILKIAGTVLTFGVELTAWVKLG